MNYVHGKGKVTITGHGRTEEVSDYEADCLRAAFYIRDDNTIPPGHPVGREPYGSITFWNLIDRLLTKLRATN